MNAPTRPLGNQPKVLKVRYKPQGPTLARFHAQRYKDLVRMVIGPLGSGKTFSAIFEILMMCHDQSPDRNGVRKSRWCISRNTFPDLNSATIPDVKEIVDHINPDGWNHNAPITWRHTYPRADDGTQVQIELQFRSFDGEQDVKKARGMQLTGAWVDEVAEFHKANLDMLIGRVKRYPPKSQVPNAKFGVIGTSNACARDHWLAKASRAEKQLGWWIGVQPGGLVRVGSGWRENPLAENLKNLPDRYYLDQATNKRESWVRLNLCNEFVVHSDGRPVHPDFNERLHVQECQGVHGVPLTIGMDFGRTPAAVVMQKDPETGQWRVLSELCTKNMGAKRFGEVLVQHLNERYDGFTIGNVTGDPAGNDMAQTRDETPLEMVQLAGLDAIPAYTNDFEVRTETLDTLLRQLIGGQPAIVVDPGCTTLIEGLAGRYQFRRIQVTSAEKYVDKPDKTAESHVCEALHYGLMGAGEGDALFDQGGSDGLSDHDMTELSKELLRYYE